MFDQSSEGCRSAHQVSSVHISEHCVLTLHHSDGVFYLRLEQVDAHYSSQVLHIHLVHLGVKLHLKQKPECKKKNRDFAKSASCTVKCLAQGHASKQQSFHILASTLTTKTPWFFIGMSHNALRPSLQTHLQT